ncbi:hypothetical protein [Paenibacillus wynnii]|uniref:Butirosin biosynthesis protein H N-terminal domain-containing protein n=1 Tax=Paenibacillus wynnii TaxID=268407 RepID=A0A098MB19_9BACL|nr:hypothetical protein [Paenibacillus wynnii]KGE19740.1 hypothetical protein PWYN_10615 [Paenibacillus wynnii]
MISISAFNPDLNVPNYINCSFPLIHEKLKSHGNVSFLSLLMNLQLNAVPVFSVPFGEEMKAFVDLSQLRLLGYRRWEEYYGISRERSVFPTFQEGLKAVRASILEQRLFLTSGATYYLPYFNRDYLNPGYIKNFGYGTDTGIYVVGNHWLSVYGMDQERLYVYDPIPNRYKDSISLEIFHAFWLGNRCIPQLADKLDIEKCLVYGTEEITVRKRHSMESALELFGKTLLTISSEYLKGACIESERCMHFFGRAADGKLYGLLDSGWREVQDYGKSFTQHVFNFRRNRQYYLEILKDYVHLMGRDDRFFLNRYLTIAGEWDAMQNSVAINVKRKRVDSLFWDTIMRRMKETMYLEEDFHEEMIEYLSGLGLTGLDKGEGEYHVQ